MRSFGTRGGQTVISIMLCCIAAACSSSAASTSTSTSTSTSASTSTSTPSAPVTMSTGVFGNARSAACDTDLNQMEMVVDSYLALNGGTEVTEHELVQQGLLREESVLHDVGPGGTVIPSPNGGCVR